MLLSLPWSAITWSLLSRSLSPHCSKLHTSWEQSITRRWFCLAKRDDMGYERLKVESVVKVAFFVRWKFKVESAFKVDSRISSNCCAELWYRVYDRSLKHVCDSRLQFKCCMRSLSKTTVGSNDDITSVDDVTSGGELSSNCFKMARVLLMQCWFLIEIHFSSHSRPLNALGIQQPQLQLLHGQPLHCDCNNAENISTLAGGTTRFRTWKKQNTCSMQMKLSIR